MSGWNCTCSLTIDPPHLADPTFSPPSTTTLRWARSTTFHLCRPCGCVCGPVKPTRSSCCDLHLALELHLQRPLERRASGRPCTVRIDESCLAPVQFHAARDFISDFNSISSTLASFTSVVRCRPNSVRFPFHCTSRSLFALHFSLLPVPFSSPARCLHSGRLTLSCSGTHTQRHRFKSSNYFPRLRPAQRSPLLYPRNPVSVFLYLFGFGSLFDRHHCNPHRASAPSPPPPPPLSTSSSSIDLRLPAKT